MEAEKTKEDQVAKKSCDDCPIQERYEDYDRFRRYCAAEKYDLEGSTRNAETCPLYVKIGGEAAYDYRDSLSKAKDARDKDVIRQFLLKPNVDAGVDYIHDLINFAYYFKEESKKKAAFDDIKAMTLKNEEKRAA